MGATSVQARANEVWDLVGRQHGVISDRQLRAHGFTRGAIRHRLATGRLHRIFPGVHAVGRRELTREGRWMAAVLTAGSGALLSHESCAALVGLRDDEVRIEVSIPRSRRCRTTALRIHRRHPGAFVDATERKGIPATGPVRLLIDLAVTATRHEAATLVNQADKLELIDPETLRNRLAVLPPEPGIPLLSELLDRATFVLTDSDLERRFLPIAARAGLATPETQVWLDGGRADFYWPELGLVVEADGLRYHRTPVQQARQALRDNAHSAAGRTPLRFTHGQIAYEEAYVEATLRITARRLADA